MIDINKMIDSPNPTLYTREYWKFFIKSKSNPNLSIDEVFSKIKGDERIEKMKKADEIETNYPTPYTPEYNKFFNKLKDARN
jgi:hypothetical protein